MGRPTTRNRAFHGAYRKGFEAALRGESCASPYFDHRGGRHGNMVTFSRAFDRYWREGWNDGKAADPDQPENPNAR